jgi:plasmid stability protein
MGQVLIRNIDDSVLDRLRARAGERQLPLERYLRDMLHEAARPSRAELLEQARRLRESYDTLPDDSTALIREDRDER